jgi:hypothetical protein
MIQPQHLHNSKDQLINNCNIITRIIERHLIQRIRAIGKDQKMVSKDIQN